MCGVCVCVSAGVPAIPFGVPFMLFPFAMAKRFIRFDFSLVLVPGNGVSARKTDEIVCRRLVEIDIKEVSVFRQLDANVGMSMAPFD